MKKSYQICYGSEHQDIDAGTLVASLMNVNDAINDINRFINSSEGTERKINIRVNGSSPGSFNLDVTIIQSIGEALSAIWASSGGIDNLISMLKNIIEIVIFLKGRSPKKVEKKGSEVAIENYNNECMTISVQQMNVYMQCPKAREAIAKNNELLSDDNDVKDFAMIESGKKLFTVSKAEMTEATTAPELVDNDNIQYVNDRDWIKAIRLSYVSSHKWSFIYKGNQINAKIEDEAFWIRVDKNEKFSKGDSFLVKLKIKQTKDMSIDAWLNKEYTVEQIIQHKSNELEQGILEL